MLLFQKLITFRTKFIENKQKNIHILTKRLNYNKEVINLVLIIKVFLKPEDILLTSKIKNVS